MRQPDLEAIAGGRVHVPPTQGSGVVAGRVCGRAIQGWHKTHHESSAAARGMTREGDGLRVVLSQAKE